MKSYSVLEKDYDSTPQEITLTGWNLKTGENEVAGLLEEDFLSDGEKIIIKKITKREIAYSCSRYCEEQDARDEGFGYWINYSKEWKRGLGKCTVFSIEWEKHCVNAKGGEQ